MNAIQFPGWTKFGTKEYFHHCGARVSKPADGLWTAQTVHKIRKTGFADAQQALRWLETNDPDFWSYGVLASFGNIAGIYFISGSYDRKRENILTVCFVPDTSDFAAHLRSTFKRLFLRKAAVRSAADNRRKYRCVR